MRKSLLIRRLDEKIVVTIKIKENRGLVKDNEVLDGKVNDLGTEAVDSKKVVETLSNQLDEEDEKRKIVVADKRISLDEKKLAHQKVQQLEKKVVELDKDKEKLNAKIKEINQVIILACIRF